MQTIVQRRWPDSVSLIGELIIDGNHSAYTLEPPYKTDGSKPRAIPSGIYDLTLRWSPRFGRLMPHVEGVDGFVGILIHWGNWAVNTEGCTLVGTIKGTDFVGHSKIAFMDIYQKFYAASVLTTGTPGGKDEVRYVGKITYLDNPDTQVSA